MSAHPWHACNACLCAPKRVSGPHEPRADRCQQSPGGCQSQTESPCQSPSPDHHDAIGIDGHLPPARAAGPALGQSWQQWVEGAATVQEREERAREAVEGISRKPLAEDQATASLQSAKKHEDPTMTGLELLHFKLLGDGGSKPVKKYYSKTAHGLISTRRSGTYGASRSHRGRGSS